MPVENEKCASLACNTSQFLTRREKLVRKREIEVFNPQARNLHLRREILAGISIFSFMFSQMCVVECPMQSKEHILTLSKLIGLVHKHLQLIEGKVTAASKKC